MAGGQEKWYFTKEQLQNSPSRKCGLDADKELAYRQQAANLIQDMGQRLQVSQLCINTAIVYMHRFYAFHSFTQFHRNAIASAALFLAAKVEEQPRKLEYVIKVTHACLHRGENVSALTPEQYQEQAQDLVFNENVLLQTLGFDVAIDHPHTHVVRTCHLVKAPKDLAQTSYFMASNSLHLTTMCLQYRPTVVACFCIHLASKWSNWALIDVPTAGLEPNPNEGDYALVNHAGPMQIPQSSEGRHWFSYVDRSVTSDLLERLTAEFLHIFDKCPSRLKRKMMTMNSGGSPSAPLASSSASSQPDKKHAAQPNDEFDKAFDKEYERERRRQPAPGGYVPATAPPAPPPQKIDYTLYREKREREERERQRQLQRYPPAPRPPHKPHAWPHHKPPHHKPPHHHRPTATQSQPQPTQPPQPTPTPNLPPEVVPQRTRPPSLFSPENATTPAAAAAAPRRPQPPPQPRPKPEQRPPSSQPPPKIPPQEKPPSPHKKRPDPSTAIREMQLPSISPFSSPPVKEQQVKQRQRHALSSELELVPVVKKLDETPGYENLIRESQRTNSNSVKNRLPEVKAERKPEPIPSRSLNGIETDPTLVSNLLKESLAKPAPITVATERKSPIEIKKEPVIEPPPPPVQNDPPPQPAEEVTEHKHKKEKKKKEKHKHKDRDKSKEERKKHKKDKEREKKKEETSHPNPPVTEPTDGTLRITIPRDKLSTSPGLKIKIPKERLAAPPPPPQGSGLKIKISKEVLETSRKRGGVPDAGPPQKVPRQNGAHPHPKVAAPLVGNGHAHGK